jgi:hypothetical protein
MILYIACSFNTLIEQDHINNSVFLCINKRKKTDVINKNSFTNYTILKIK